VTSKLWCVNPSENKIKSCKNVSVAEDHLSIYFFYVSNESVLITLPNSKHILYDCGDVSAAADLHEKMVDLGVTALDVMVASHTHKDHVAGFYEFASIPDRQVKMGDLYDNGEESSDKWFVKYKEFRNNLPDGGTYHSMRSSQGNTQLSLDDTVFINLYVSYDWIVTSESSRKYRSLWMKIKYKNSTILLAGDSKKAYEKIMVNNFPIGESQILKLSEHGSRESTTKSFLERTKPLFAVACNKDHPNLPHPEVIERLQNNHVKLYSTIERENDIEIHTDGTLNNGLLAYKFIL